MDGIGFENKQEVIDLCGHGSPSDDDDEDDDDDDEAVVVVPVRRVAVAPSNAKKRPRHTITTSSLSLFSSIPLSSRPAVNDESGASKPDPGLLHEGRAAGTNYEATTKLTRAVVLVVLQTTNQKGEDERVTVTENVLEPFLVRQGLLFTPRPIRTCQSSTLLHVQQHDSWSCGYRNLQMMMSALLPSLSPQHPYFIGRRPAQPDNDDDAGAQGVVVMDIPSLEQIQHCLEQAWALGMDPRGCQHYGGRIAGTRDRIGAVEVSTALRALNLDASVVQFVRVAESRSQLGPFCGEYFSSSQSGACACEGGRGPNLPVKSRELAIELLRRAASGIATAPRQPPSAADPVACPKCSSRGPPLPLYLQYEGHSVTVVGVEHAGRGQCATEVVNLLVFDPRQNGDQLRSALLLSPPPEREQQQRQGIDLGRLRRSVSLLHAKDTQLVVCTAADAEGDDGIATTRRNNRTVTDLSVVTACEDAVARHYRRCATK